MKQQLGNTGDVVDQLLLTRGAGHLKKETQRRPIPRRDIMERMGRKGKTEGSSSSSLGILTLSQAPSFASPMGQSQLSIPKEFQSFIQDQVQRVVMMGITMGMNGMGAMGAMGGMSGMGGMGVNGMGLNGVGVNGMGLNGGTGVEAL